MYFMLQELLQKRVELLWAGRFEELAQYYSCPHVIYEKDQTIVLRNHSDMAGAFAKLLASQIARGVERLEAEVVAAELPRNGRFRIWTRYSEIDRDGRVMSCNDILKYCVKTSTGIRIEMTESGSYSMAESACLNPEKNVAKSR
jgi:hypothetical protein